MDENLKREVFDPVFKEVIDLLNENGAYDKAGIRAMPKQALEKLYDLTSRIREVDGVEYAEQRLHKYENGIAKIGGELYMVDKKLELESFGDETKKVFMRVVIQELVPLDKITPWIKRDLLKHLFPLYGSNERIPSVYREHLS